MPMFGLSALEHALHPESTLDKIYFLFEHVQQSSHTPTVIISFTTLAILICFRITKTLGRWKWIQRVPEVLITVVVATGTVQEDANACTDV